MKRLILPLLLAAISAALPSFAAPARSIFGDQSEFEPFDVLENVWLVLTPGTGEVYDEVWADWRQGDTRVRVHLSQGDAQLVDLGYSASAWSAKLPVNHAGKAYYTYTVVMNGGQVTYFKDGSISDPDKKMSAAELEQKCWSYEIKENFTSASALGPARYPDILEWGVSGNNLGNSWSGYNYDHQSGAGQKIRLYGPENPFADLLSTKPGTSMGVQGRRGLLRSPRLAGGVGSIWFKARMVMPENEAGGLLKVARITTKGSSTKTQWFSEDVASVPIPPAEEYNQWQQFRLVLQDYAETAADRAYYAIYNNTATNYTSHYLTNAIEVCDIVLTPPVPEVRIVKDNVEYSPRIPSVLDPVDFRIEVEDVYPEAPVQFVTPRLVWRQGGDTEPWHEMVMTNILGKTVQTAGTYAYTLTKADRLADGPFEYFYEVSYAGYTPLFPAIKYPGNIGFNNVVNARYDGAGYPYLIDTKTLSFLTTVTNRAVVANGVVKQPIGLISECRSPAIFPDFERQWQPDFRYPFEPIGTFSEYVEYAWGTCVVPGTDATNSLWGFTHRFDPRNLVSSNGYESVYGGTINLWRAPRTETWNMVRPDSDLAYPEPGEVQIEEEFRFLTLLASDGVRRFRSNFTDLAAVSEDHPLAAKPSLLEPSYAMQHVGDYTWQAIFHITNRIDALFSVTGACPTAAGSNPANPDSDRPVVWMQADQDETDINPPMSGAMILDEASGELVHNTELVQFDTRPVTNVVRKIEKMSSTTFTNGPLATFEPGTLVGVVTNAPWCYVNEGGYPAVVDRAEWTMLPGDGDVEFWFGRVETTIDSFETNGIPFEITNSVVVEDISTNVWVDDGGAWTDIRKAPYSDWIGHPDRVEVTNAATVTLATYLVPVTTTWLVTNWVTNVVYEAKTEGTPYEDSDLGTRVDIDYDGFLMFRFCTTNGAYQIRRAAWQDFNGWQADNDYYDQSFGLYDMQTWESDLEGAELTPFAKNFTTYTLEDLPVSDDWADDDGTLVSGLVMKFGKVVEDRGHRNGKTAAEPTDQDRNKAILLDAYPQHRGSLTTTSATSNREEDDGVVVGGGRDTLRMRVRSYTDDDRTITYMGDDADTWSDYRVAARIMSPNSSDVSPGEHSISLIGYWKSNQNYWEARIIQKSEFTGQQTTPVRNWFEVHVYNWVRGKATEVFGGVSRAGDGNRYRGDGNQWNQPHAYVSSATKMATWPVWNNANNKGTTNERGYSGGQADYGLFTSTYGDGWTFVFDLKTDGSAVKPVVWAFRNVDIKNGTANQYYKYDCSSDGNCAMSGTALKGRPGWNTRDCGLKLGVYAFDNSGETPETVTFTGSSARDYKAMSQSTTSTDWDHNEFRDSNQPDLDVWDWKAGVTDITTGPVVLQRKKPLVWYNVQVYRTLEEANADTVAPVPADVNGQRTSWADDWDGYHGHASDADQPCQSWGWTDVTFPMAFWDDVFVRVRTRDEKDGAYARAKLVVDGLECSGWRGKTVSDGDWRAYYAVVAHDPATQNGRYYELNRTRANPTERASHEQSIVSPYLENGIGGILFNYRVSEHPVRIDVQMGSGSSWSSAPGYPRELPVTAPEEKPTLYVGFLAPGKSGRIRIVALDKEDPENPDYDARETGELGTLFVDNIRVTDYPRTGDSSWEVYNALVSNFSDTTEKRRLKFDGLSDAARTMRTAVLNDATGGRGTDAETLLDQELDLHVPFIQTPSIDTGVGEISFWYRASPDNGENPAPAKITLLIAKSAGVPDEEWIPLVPDNLNTNMYEVVEGSGVWEYENENLEAERAAMAGLTNIVTSDWTYFSAEFYQGDYHVLRIVSGDGTTPAPNRPAAGNRVMIDNVLITEPVRSSIDVGTIEFLPGVPTTQRSTGAKVTLVNPRLNPKIEHVYLDWYVASGALTDHTIETVDVDVQENQTTQYAVITNFPTDGVNTRVSYPVKTIVTTVTTNIDPTVVSAPLLDPDSRPWGFEAWGSHPSGTIELTNSAAAGERYTYYTKEDIPTDTFEPDVVMQYAVRVEYTGAFAEPVNSATQGRAKNGFWFENPPWYEPIDLNVAFGTEERPVAHAFVFSCTTNVVWINEFRPRLGVQNVNHQDEQFVELMGPAGAGIGGWRLEHWWSLLNNRVDPSWINYTNILKDTAVFVGANNATTNKGWGTYLLGCSALSDLDGSAGFEWLFPDHPDAETNPGTDVEPSHPFINNYGAMRLRRRMGAYVNRISWGTTSQAKTMTDQGFEHAKYISNVTLESRAGSVLFRDVGSSGEALDWIARTGYGYETPGGYNSRAQENFLPSLEEDEEVRASLIDRPVILGFDFDEEDPTKVVLTFRVSVTNDVALEEKTKYGWTVEHRSDLRAGYGDWNPFTTSQTEWLDEPNDVPANGTKDVRVRVPADPGASGRGIRFFQIRATPTK